MNKKLLLGAAAAAGIAAYMMNRKKSSSKTMTGTSSDHSSRGQQGRHRTDVFSNAKNTGSESWSPSSEPLK